MIFNSFKGFNKMETSLNQVYQLEKEMLEQRSKYDQYYNNEILCTQNIKIFEFSLDAIEEQPSDRAVYQPLGKAFLRRPKEALANDLRTLLESNEKSLGEHRRMKEHFETKKIELEKQLVELTKGLKLN